MFTVFRYVIKLTKFIRVGNISKIKSKSFIYFFCFNFCFTWRIRVKNYKLLLNQPKSYCVYHFPIHLEPNEIPFGSKLTRQWYIQSDFGSYMIFSKYISRNFVTRTKYFTREINIDPLRDQEDLLGKLQRIVVWEAGASWGSNWEHDGSWNPTDYHRTIVLGEFKEGLHLDPDYAEKR